MASHIKVVWVFESESDFNTKDEKGVALSVPSSVIPKKLGEGGR